MRKNKGYDFFGMFIQASRYSEQAISFLSDILDHYSPDEIKNKINEMHKIEQSADTAKHEMQSALAKAFITPIEREDILLLAQKLDDVTDAIEDVLLRLYMYHVTAIRPEMKEFIPVITGCCHALTKVMSELSQFKKVQKDLNGSTLTQTIIEVNRLEEEGDRIYLEVMRKLFMSENNPVELFIWGEIFERLEKCSDACERVANQVDSIVMKNS